MKKKRPMEEELDLMSDSTLEDSRAILARRRLWVDRQRRRWRRLLITGIAGGMAAHLAGCYPCLIMPQRFECEYQDPTYNPMAAHFRISAAWRSVADIWHVVVTVTSELTSRDYPAVPMGSPTVTDASLIAQNPSPEDVTLLIQPAPGATLIQVDIPYNCDEDLDPDAFVRFALDVSGMPGTGVSVPVSIGSDQ